MDILASNPPALANSGADPFTNPQPYAISSIEARVEVAPAEAAPCGTCERIGRSGHADDIDEQRAGPSFGQQRAFEHLHVVGEIVARELWVATMNQALEASQN